MIRKLQKVGKSRALIISKELAALIGLREDEDVQLEVFGNVIQIRPATAPEVPLEEGWLHTSSVRQSLDRALAWDATHPVATTDFTAFDQAMTERRKGKR